MSTLQIVKSVIGAIVGAVPGALMLGLGGGMFGTFGPAVAICLGAFIGFALTLPGVSVGRVLGGTAGAMVAARVPSGMREEVMDWFLPDEQDAPLSVWSWSDDPDAARMRHALERGEFEEVEVGYRGLNGREDREVLVSALSDWDERPEFIEQWTKQRDDSPLAWTIRGCHSSNWAWGARGSGTSSTVSDDGRRLWHDRMLAAREELNRAAALDPSEPAPHAELIWVAFGLEDEREHVQRHFDAAIERFPEHYGAHAARLTFLCAKWFGSHDEMFHFAREASARAAVGSYLHSLVSDAHTERWLYYRTTEKDGRDMDYWKDDNVRAEILTAYEKSLGTEAYKPSRRTRSASNSFAFTLTVCQHAQQALCEIRRIGTKPSESPWNYLGAPLESYRKLTEYAVYHSQ